MSFESEAGIEWWHSRFGERIEIGANPWKRARSILAQH